MSDGAGGPRPLAIVDIDGVVADVRHRLHFVERRPKDWRSFFAAAVDDAAHPEGLAIVATLAETCEVLFLTGRPANLEAATQQWLDDHGLGGHRLVHRPVDDHRPAAEVKAELLGRLAAGRPVMVVVDDDPQVIAAMRAAGYPGFLATWEPRRADEERTLRRAQEDEGRT